jgi:hypothetical protein
MKKIAIAALLTALGSGAALAQGAPPGSPSWHSGWPGVTELRQAQAMNARKPTTTRPDQFAASRSVPVAGNPQATRRGG